MVNASTVSHHCGFSFLIRAGLHPGSSKQKSRQAMTHTHPARHNPTSTYRILLPPILSVKSSCTSILMCAQAPRVWTGKADSSSSAGGMWMKSSWFLCKTIHSSRKFNIQHFILQENQLLIQELQDKLPCPCNPLQLLIQVTAFESFCTPVCSKRLGCFTHNHLSAYAHLGFERYNFAGQKHTLTQLG